MTPGTIAISGAGGLVGAALVESLAGPGRPRILRLTRGRGGGADSVVWDPAAGRFDAERLEGCEAVVHLAGEPIAAGRWSASRKEAIRSSRVEGTRLLVGGLLGLAGRPSVLVCASAIGWYGDRGDEILTEDAPAGRGFLAEVVSGWEAEASGAAAGGIRVVSLRLGVVLSSKGGALPRMLPPFRLGIGGRLGSGRQWMSWVHVDDVVEAIRFALQRADLRGPVNVTAPEPVTNAAFTTALARALGRPALLPAPAFALKLALGEMAGALLLSSQRVTPQRLLEQGFTFRHPRVEDALGRLLARR